jgi:aspartyl-tRNA(Asn)/glutamyl-tRNA(Gln) amidotransferase subunit A
VKRSAPQANSEPEFLTIEQASGLLQSKKISPVDLVDLALARIERGNPAINAFITVMADSAREDAKHAEGEIRRSGVKSPLHGLPISLKDNFLTQGVRTTAGSKILADFLPDRDSDVALQLKRAGAILIGKTNMHEFAYGITSENPHYGPVRNPWALDRISGGSSGGSVASVACGMGFASVGTDTGGSLRIPSALCGTVGVKPTFGLVSVRGVVPLALTLDHVGPLARNVGDACIMLEAIAGPYPKGVPRPRYRQLRGNRLEQIRLGWPDQLFFDKVDAEVRCVIEAAGKHFESLGARVERVSLPNLSDSAGPSTDIALAEAAYFHKSRGYFPARAAEYGPDVRDRLELAGRVRAVDYLRGFEMQRALKRDFDDTFERVDAILAPASPIKAPYLGQSEVAIDGRLESIRSLLVGVCRPANFTGHPAVSIPCGFTTAGLPVGLQLIGPRWGEAKLLALALAYEDATPWHEMHPRLA